VKLTPDFLVHVLTGVNINGVVDADHGCQGGDDAPEDQESTASLAVQYRLDASDDTKRHFTGHTKN